MVLDIGSSVEPVEAYDQNGDLKRVDFDGLNILYFYPKDNTPGCTKEACGFRDNMDMFKEFNTNVYGVSADTVSSHKKFAEKYDLNFTLLADKDKNICKQFDVPALKYPSRITYIIKDREVVYVDDSVSPKEHSEELLNKLEELK